MLRVLLLVTASVAHGLPSTQGTHSLEILTTGSHVALLSKELELNQFADRALESKAYPQGPANHLQRILLTVNLLFIFLAVYCLWASNRSSQGAPRQEGFLGMKTSSQVAIFVVYVSLACTHTFTQHKAGATNYSLVSATALIYVFKFIVAFGMFQTRGDGALCDVFKSSAELGQPRFGRIPAIVLLAFPAILYTFYDLLSFMTLARMDPVTYQILRSGRIILIAGIWQPALGRTINTMQMTALIFFMAASLSKGVDSLQEEGGFDAASFMTSGVLLICLQIMLSIFANVASEVCLKQIPLHTDLMNTCSYGCGVIALSFYLVIQYGPYGVYTELLAPAAWGRLFGDVWMCASISTLVVFGIITAYFLRDLSNILKELSFGFVILVTAAIEYTFSNSACTVLGGSAITLTVLAIMVYNADPLATAPKTDSPTDSEKDKLKV